MPPLIYYSLPKVTVEQYWVQNSLLQRPREDKSASESRDYLCCSVKSGNSCLFDDFSSLDFVLNKCLFWGPVFLQIYL